MIKFICFSQINLSNAVKGCFLALSLVPVSGCGGEATGVNQLGLKLYPVKGKVELHDGSPLTAGGVEFVLISGPAISSTGEVGSDGSYTLKTEGMGDGAPAGDYRVRIVPTEANFKSASKKNTVAKSIDTKKLGYNIKFLDEDDSGLTAVVKPQDNQLEPFRLTK